MTELSKPVSRTVDIDGTTYVVTIGRAGVTLREKGRRTTYGPVAWGHILLDGARLLAEERRPKRKRRTVSRSLLRA